MQYRGFVQFSLLLLASGCLVLGLISTLVALVAFAAMIELAIWFDAFDKDNETLGRDECYETANAH